MDVKIRRSTEVIISLDSEEVAGKLMRLLVEKVDFFSEPWANELYTALDALEVSEADYVELKEPSPPTDVINVNTPPVYPFP